MARCVARCDEEMRGLLLLLLLLLPGLPGGAGLQVGGRGAALRCSRVAAGVAAAPSGHLPQASDAWPGSRKHERSGRPGIMSASGSPARAAEKRGPEGMCARDKGACRLIAGSGDMPTRLPPPPLPPRVGDSGCRARCCCCCCPAVAAEGRDDSMQPLPPASGLEAPSCPICAAINPCCMAAACAAVFASQLQLSAGARVRVAWHSAPAPAAATN